MTILTDSQKEAPSSPSPPPSVMLTTSLHDDQMSSSSPKLNKDEEMLEVISDPKSAVSFLKFFKPFQ
jgi:hypothetical protein